MLTIAILTLVIAAALWVALALKAGPAPAVLDPHAPITCMPDEESREVVRAIMQEALAEALREHIKHSFEVWMRDAREQPQRAANGIRQGIRAYVSSRTFVQTWNPPNCQ